MGGVEIETGSIDNSGSLPLKVTGGLGGSWRGK